VTSAALVMVAVFAVFASLRLLEFKQLGIGLAAAILVDAVVVRAVVLPAVMTLLGRANWWPGKLSRPSTHPQYAETPEIRQDSLVQTEELASRR
jgi:putative drug exporter of the RND superfamily